MKGRLLSELMRTRLFSRFELLFLSLGFVLLLAGLNQMVRHICLQMADLDCPPYWPISEFYRVEIGFLRTGAALLVTALFLVLLLYLARAHFPLGSVLLAGCLLVPASNLVQGWERGFVTPIADVEGGAGSQYYNDLEHVDDPLSFLRRFVHLQPGLSVHGRTHPPGAVLTLYGLSRLVSHPGLIGLAVAIMATLLCGYFMNRILWLFLQDVVLSGYLTLLLLLLPGVQIYFAASLDAIIAAVLTGALFFWIHPRRAPGALAAFLCLLLASFLSFGFLFILPVMAGLDWFQRRSLFRFIGVLTGLALVYAGLHHWTGFDYLRAFLTASVLENPKGFRLLAEPFSYLMTRTENVLELWLFLGPFVSLLALRGWKFMERGAPPRTLTGLALLTLGAVYLSGAFHTGETARSCLFIYPYLLLPVAVYLQEIRVSPPEETGLLVLVFGQTVAMQWVGNYFW